MGKGFEVSGYFLLEAENGIGSSIWSKTHVAPLCLGLTIIGSPVAEITNEQHTMTIEKTYFLIDLKTLLGWLKSKTRDFYNTNSGVDSSEMCEAMIVDSQKVLNFYACFIKEEREEIK